MHLCCPLHSERRYKSDVHAFSLFTILTIETCLFTPADRYKSEVHTSSLLTVLPSKPSFAIGGLASPLQKCGTRFSLFTILELETRLFGPADS
jgi:hypothetical protein